ncbi:MAG TPA: hypothetical protein VMV83_09965 [Rectinemataceae bacterium]|nr:hypothetical protein [Rectinemataceae bacterium]
MRAASAVVVDRPPISLAAAWLHSASLRSSWATGSFGEVYGESRRGHEEAGEEE